MCGIRIRWSAMGADGKLTRQGLVSLIMTVTADCPPRLLAADEAQGAGLADRLVPAVDAEPVVQAYGSLLGRGSGDAQLAGDNGERECRGKVPQDLGLCHGDRRCP